MALYIGLMSGTSADGIDAALIEITSEKTLLLATHYQVYEKDIRESIFALCHAGHDEINRMGELDVKLGRLFASAVKDLLKKAAVLPTKVKAIGSHGQTIRHAPNNQCPFTLQIADPNIIAAETNITTIADFRRRDIALGGCGAPLVPAFHHHLWSSDKIDRAIVNIGGIANVTLLSKEHSHVLGFDIGPGNVLMDSWIQAQQQKSQDENGNWAASGKVNNELLQQMLADNYFALQAPKSTGREYFNLAWITKYIKDFNKPISAIDVQATLTELTATTIVNSIQNYFQKAETFICGGGAYNKYLVERIAHLAKDNVVKTTQDLGLAPEWVEASAFAWLAHQTLNNLPGNLPSVTNAKEAAILGGIYYS